MLGSNEVTMVIFASIYSSRLCMVCVWFVYGLCMVCVWFVSQDDQQMNQGHLGRVRVLGSVDCVLGRFLDPVLLV